MKTWIPWVVALGAGVGVMALSRTSHASDASFIVDRREHAKLSEKAAPHTRTRAEEDVYALVLHQMGFSRGSDPSKYNGVTAHYLVLPDGGVYQLHDHTVRLPAASGLNSGSVSVEFAGNFPSKARSTDPSSFWSPETHGMNQLTAAQTQSGRRLVDYFVKQGWLTHILAHRQGGEQRQNDPGPDVWREVGAWAVRQHGLEWGGKDFAVNGGQPIPDAWWGATGGAAVA